MNPGTMVVLIMAGLIAACFLTEWAWNELKFRRREHKRKVRRRELERWTDWWELPSREPRRRA